MPRAPRLDRRRFLNAASVSAFVLATHGPSVWAAGAGRGTALAGRARIESLRLSTGASLDSMRAFYVETLGLPEAEAAAGEFAFRAGSSTITFVPVDGAPFYHFAFNIPENKILAARRWQLDRTPLSPVRPELRDPEFPDDVVHFRHWNAHSLFFTDPAGNVVEYIARHDLDNAAEGAFDVADILYASEIAFVSDDVPELARGLEASFDLAPYRGGSDRFRAVGDEHGLLLVFARGRSLGVGEERRAAETHPVEARIRGKAAATFRPLGLPYDIRSRNRR